jgi:hypothetical protein
MFFSSRALDSFDQYLHDVEKYPLIEDPEQERALAPRPERRQGGRGAAGHGEPPLRHLLREEVSGTGARPRRAGLYRQRRPAEGGQEVRSGEGREVHLLRGLVDPADGPPGARGADALGPDPAQPELEPRAAVADGDGAHPDAGRSPTDQEIADEMAEPIDTIRALRGSRRASSRWTRRSTAATATPPPSASGSPEPRPRRSRRRSNRRRAASSSSGCSRST